MLTLEDLIKAESAWGRGKVGGDSVLAFAADVAGYSRRYTDAGSTRQWARSIGLAAAVGVAYFLAALAAGRQPQQHWKQQCNRDDSPPKILRQKNDESMRSKTRLISSIISQASQLSWPLNCRKRLNSKSSVMRSALKFMICWMCYRATLAKSCSMASVQGSRDKRAALTTWRRSKWAHGLSFIVVVWPRKIRQIFARHEPLIRFD